MELQEYFDKTVTHLRSGQGRAVGSHGTCMYSTWDDKKCAVGIHIPDGHQAILDGYEGTVNGLVNTYPDLLGVAVVNLRGGLDLALELQDSHDTSTNWDDLTFEGEANLKSMAERFGLTYTPPKEGI